jgi:hypothetical protein
MTARLRPKRYTGSMVELRTGLPVLRCTLSKIVHRTKRLGGVSHDFLQHCMHSAEY